MGNSKRYLEREIEIDRERERRENSNRNEKTRDKIVEFFAWNIFKIRSMFVEYY